MSSGMHLPILVQESIAHNFLDMFWILQRTVCGSPQILRPVFLYISAILPYIVLFSSWDF
jgi:hypothetical protein